MRGLLVFSCRAFPPDHRARRSDEVVDTALLAANGSAWRAGREALSLVRAGFGQRVRLESARPLRDGLAPLAWVLAVVNLAVALVGAAAERAIPILASRGFVPFPYRPDWWWIAFTVAAVGIVLGLILGDRRLALGAALGNLGLLAYDALFPFSQPGGHLLDLFFLGPSFPVGTQWLAPAVLLALATAAAPLRRLPLTRLPLAVGVVAALVVLSREMRPWGDFLFLRWPLAALVVLSIAFGALIPRLAVLALGLVLAAAPSSVTLFAGSTIDRASVIWSLAAGFVLGAFVPFARLVRRRLA
jgi:hypothetical protein